MLFLQRSPQLSALPVLMLLASLSQAALSAEDAHAQDVASAGVPTGSVRPAAEESARKQLGVLEELTHYDLELELVPLTRRFTLTERVRFVNHEPLPLRELAFYTYADAYGAKRSDGSEAVQLVEGSCEQPRECKVSSEPHGITRVRLDRPLKRGESITVTLTLSGEAPVISAERASFMAQTMESFTSLMGGAMAKDFGILAANDEIMSLGGFYPVLAARRNGHWDTHTTMPIGDLTSDDVFHVSARIRAPSGMRVITPGVTAAVRDVGNGMSEHEVHAALVRDFAVMASDRLLTSEKRVGDVTVRAHVLPHSQANAPQVLQAAADSLALFEQTFGPYPYTELDVVEAPLVGGVGGVEFSGLVTVAQMLLQPDQRFDLNRLSSILSLAGGGATDSLKSLIPDSKEMLDLVVAHEVAHQWWHVLVGSDSRREPFTDEGLAQWSALYFLERARGSEVAKHAEQQLVTSYQTMRMLGNDDAPVSRPAESFPSMLAYGGIVYGKGPLVYRELRKAVGDEVFLGTLAEYVQRHAFGRAPKNAFLDMLARKANSKQVHALARRWLEETHGDQDLGTLNLGSAGPGGSGLGGLDLGGLDLGGLLGGKGQSLPELMQQLDKLLGGQQP